MKHEEANTNVTVKVQITLTGKKKEKRLILSPARMLDAIKFIYICLKLVEMVIDFFQYIK